MLFHRNKELLRGVGRRDFELGSAPVFPAERVEIVLEEWYTTSKLHGLEQSQAEFPSFIRLPPYYSLRRTFGGKGKTKVTLMCVGRGSL